MSRLAASMPMTRRELIKGRLDAVRKGRQNGPSLEEVLAELMPDILDWAPVEGMRTVRGQLVEILEIEIPLVPYLKDGKLPSNEEYAQLMGNPESLDELKAKLNEVRSRTLAYLDTLSEEDLTEEIPSDPWFGSFWQANLPRAEIFINVAAHELYHIGQLVSYLWMRGDNPYEWPQYLNVSPI